MIAKIWLIGRAYAAAIERRSNAAGTNDDFYIKKVAPRLQGSDLDAWIHAAARGALDEGAVLDATLAAHARLTSLFERLTGLKKRSLASKYLHFHVPGRFYIYDSRAVAAIHTFKPITHRVPKYKGRVDGEYAGFVVRCQRLREYLQQEFGCGLDPRQLDNLLLLMSGG